MNTTRRLAYAATAVALLGPLSACNWFNQTPPGTGKYDIVLDFAYPEGCTSSQLGVTSSVTYADVTASGVAGTLTAPITQLTAAGMIQCAAVFPSVVAPLGTSTWNFSFTYGSPSNAGTANGQIFNLAKSTGNIQCTKPASTAAITCKFV
jgi:hypothetical protein